MSGENWVYPGRFQPMTKGHVGCLETMRSNYEIGRIVIAFPENRVRTRENPFLTEETKRIIELSMNRVEIMGIKMDTDLYHLWQKYIGQFLVDVVMTGNKTMAKIINTVGQGKTRAVCFSDGSISPIRASEVREMIRRGEKGWREMVRPGVAEYIESLPIDWQKLPESRKRWYQ